MGTFGMVSEAIAELLRRLMLRRYLRQWKNQIAEAQQLEIQQLYRIFSQSALTNPLDRQQWEHEPSVITRRPGVEELFQCLQQFNILQIPPKCSHLRGEIWQIVLSVCKRNQHSASAREFDRILHRSRKSTRCDLLVQEAIMVCEMVRNQIQIEKMQEKLESLIVYYMSTKSIEYESGMAHLMACFFIADLPLAAIYDCFYQFCGQCLHHIWLYQVHSVSQDETEVKLLDDVRKRFLRERKELVEQLLCYHDPALAHFLNQWCWNEWSEPDHLIPGDFFTDTLFRRMPPSNFVYLLDQYLLTGDTMFGLFFLLAILIQRRDTFLNFGEATSLTESNCSTGNIADQVRSRLVTVTQNAVESQDEVQFLCVFASRLWLRTPKSYNGSLEFVQSDDGFMNDHSAKKKTGGLTRRSSSRAAIKKAFRGIIAPKSVTSVEKLPVDMSDWQRRQSTSISGKSFWYNVVSGKTQWEHPAESIPRAVSYFALTIGISEVGVHVMGSQEPLSSVSKTNTTKHHMRLNKAQHRALRYFVVDCRALRSSQDLECGQIPSAYTLDPSVFDSPELIAKALEALEPLKSLVHIVLVGSGVGISAILIKDENMKSKVRDAVRHDVDNLNRAALFFQKQDFRFVSILDGGFASWHAFMCDSTEHSLQELTGHIDTRCQYCRYDEWALTGADPFLKRFAVTNLRRNRSMPTDSALPVNDMDSSNDQKTNYRESALSFSALEFLSRASSSMPVSRSSLTNMKTRITETKRLPWSKISFSTANPWKKSKEIRHHDRWSTASENAIDDDRDSIRTNTSAEETTSCLSSSSVRKLMLSSPTKSAHKAQDDVFTIEYSDDEELRDDVAAMMEHKLMITKGSEKEPGRTPSTSSASSNVLPTLTA
uniref:TBC1 domain family member 23 n=1 Tax=Albugo laibachii Nc14 TaxID=890382 RepID=F0WES2_9STRA|nr:conserved hypothetical protein [Albugo laibachii Nc14]|eukprot:CCA19704.1 conserved hypothetical protein [Albugo laibachii Nc14]